MLKQTDINYLIEEAKSFIVTDEDINKLQVRLDKFELENKTLTFNYNLVYNL